MCPRVCVCCLFWGARLSFDCQAPRRNIACPFGIFASVSLPKAFGPFTKDSPAGCAVPTQCPFLHAMLQHQAPKAQNPDLPSFKAKPRKPKEARSPSSALLPFFGGEGFPTKIDRKKSVPTYSYSKLPTGGPRQVYKYIHARQAVPASTAGPRKRAPPAEARAQAPDVDPAREQRRAAGRLLAVAVQRVAQRLGFWAWSTPRTMWMDKACNTFKAGKPLFVGIYRRLIVPGLLRWCRISSIHSRCPFQLSLVKIDGFHWFRWA